MVRVLSLVLGRKNGGKTTYVQDIIRSRIDCGEKLFMLVPEQFSFESERRMLALLGEKKAMRVEVCGFTRLAQNLLGDTAAGRLTAAGRVVLMSVALEQTQDKLAVYGRFARSIGVVTEMLRVSDELKQCAVTPAQLEAAAHRLPENMLRKKLLDLSIIMSAFEALTSQHFADERDSLSLLAESLDTNGFFNGATVVIDGFKGFTQQELEVISRIVGQSREVYITLCTDSAFGGEYDITPFACVRKTAKRLIDIANKRGVQVFSEKLPEHSGRYASPCLNALEKGLYFPSAVPFDGEVDAVKVYAASTAYDECEYVALTIKKLLREEKRRCRDIAVISRSEGSYSKALRSAMKKHGVPVFEDKRMPIASQPPAVLVRAALEIAARGFSSDAVFRLLKTQLAGLSVEETAELENYVFTWQIDGGKWLGDWTQNPSGLGNAPTESDRKKLERLNSLRLKCVAPLAALRTKLNDCNGTEMIREIFNYLQSINVPENLKALAVALNAAGESDGAIEYGRVWDRLMGIFDEMAAALGETRPGTQRLLELFALVLSVQDMGVIPHGIDEITIGSAERVRLNRPKIVFAVGVNEGVFPKRPSAGRVLNDADRSVLTELGVTVAEPSQFAFLEERHIAYNALCSASERLYITYCNTDFSGAECTPSELVTQVLKLLPACTVTDSTDLAPLDLVQSEASAFMLLSRGWHTQSTLEETLKACFNQNEAYTPRLKALERTGSKAEFNIDESDVAIDLFGSEIYASATRVEDYSRCPFMFFCRHGLKLNERKKAEVDSLLSGTVVHYVLENLIGKYSSELVKLSEEQIRAQITALLDTFLSENMSDLAQQGERFEYLYKRLCDSLCVVVSRLVNEMKNSDFVPADFELQIGGDNAEISAFEIPLDDGGKVVLNGKVDRVDVLKVEDKTFVRVMDYKTGSKTFDLSDVLHGINIQMLLYLFAIKDNGSKRYGCVTPAGVLYVPAKSKGGTVERSTTREEINNLIKKEGRMTGLLLDDARVVHSTDVNETGEIVAGLNKSLIGLAQLGKLEKTVCSIVSEMGMKLHSGAVPALPVQAGNDKLPCEYCGYADVCLHEESDNKRCYNRMKFEECLEVIDGDGEENA